MILSYLKTPLEGLVEVFGRQREGIMPGKHGYVGDAGSFSVAHQRDFEASHAGFVVVEMDLYLVFVLGHCYLLVLFMHQSFGLSIRRHWGG